MVRQKGKTNWTKSTNYFLKCPKETGNKYNRFVQIHVYNKEETNTNVTREGDKGHVYKTIQQVRAQNNFKLKPKWIDKKKKKKLKTVHLPTSCEKVTSICITNNSIATSASIRILVLASIPRNRVLGTGVENVNKSITVLAPSPSANPTYTWRQQ